jgi:hypothetical protein
MVKKKASAANDGTVNGKPAAKKAYCKESGCFEGPQIKGFCRTHFLKTLAAKNLKADDDFEDLRVAAKNRRKANRLEGFDGKPALDEEQLSRESERLSELDLDIEEVDVDSIVKKTG